MFDSYSGGNSIKINAVSGTIVKNCKESFFLSFHLNSYLAEHLLGAEPHYQGKKVVVLQMMMSGEKQVIAEVINKDDFENLFREEEE